MKITKKYLREVVEQELRGLLKEERSTAALRIEFAQNWRQAFKGLGRRPHIHATKALEALLKLLGQPSSFEEEGEEHKQRKAAVAAKGPRTGSDGMPVGPEFDEKGNLVDDGDGVYGKLFPNND